MSKSSFYYIWRDMLNRCYWKKGKDYKWYGERGIIVCEKWLSFLGFREDMYDTYQKGLSLDRINSNSSYCKENCRWTTQKIQQNNRRNNNFIEHMGIKDNILNWANYLNVKRSTLAQRWYVYKWSMDKIINKI